MLSAKTAHEIASIARTATEIRDLEELHELSNLVEACSRTGSRSVGDLVNALNSTNAKNQSQRAAELERAIRYAFDLCVLPEKASASDVAKRRLTELLGKRKPWDEKPWHCNGQ